MTWICSGCGEENKPKFRFCFGCGAARPAAENESTPITSAVAAAPQIEIRSSEASERKAPQPSERPVDDRPMPPAQPKVNEEDGWRCAECWMLNSNADPVCVECGLKHSKSDRRMKIESVRSIFGRFGKIPAILFGFLLIIAAVAAAYYYLNPKHAEPIDAPPGLETAVREDVAAETTRDVAELQYFNCYSTKIEGVSELGGYGVLVKLAPKSPVKGVVPPDPDREWHYIAHRDGYGWKLRRFRIESAPADPCVR